MDLGCKHRYQVLLPPFPSLLSLELMYDVGRGQAPLLWLPAYTSLITNPNKETTTFPKAPQKSWGCLSLVWLGLVALGEPARVAREMWHSRGLGMSHKPVTTPKTEDGRRVLSRGKLRDDA